MNAEFNWWLLIVGLVVGAGLVWFVVADSRRRDADIDADERPREALWLAAVLGREGRPVAPETVARLLDLHQVYLESPPPDEPIPQEPPERTGSGATVPPSTETRETPNVAPPEPALTSRKSAWPW